MAAPLLSAGPLPPLQPDCSLLCRLMLWQHQRKLPLLLPLPHQQTAAPMISAELPPGCSLLISLRLPQHHLNPHPQLPLQILHMVAPLACADLLKLLPLQKPQHQLWGELQMAAVGAATAPEQHRQFLWGMKLSAL